MPPWQSNGTTRTLPFDNCNVLIVAESTTDTLLRNEHDGNFEDCHGGKPSRCTSAWNCG